MNFTLRTWHLELGSPVTCYPEPGTKSNKQINLMIEILDTVYSEPQVL
jgi:hypothetical protein